MSEHGACLQTYNQELVKCLEELKSNRVGLVEIIKREESEQAVLERNISVLQEKLHNIQSKLKYHKQLYDDYTSTIQETEAGFKKRAVRHFLILFSTKLINLKIIRPIKKN
ncbi:Sjoegren syndrome nuclear autoantigen 1 homolog isoform X1 [Coccinella septempunctata]|uniref:Sjoegren syndrome nuclear autoantigen 1 homolog isoform X1 n=1 Tax=Coccinella septempunctata TaxID=41139 RepID=UPI001D068075|nr:Sjoegren syndrome nuclear autoantigen 1 homolog isoform X1 [Coccinella septempunctata]